MSNSIDGKLVASSVKQAVKQEVEELHKKHIKPCLAVILVGENPD